MDSNTPITSKKYKTIDLLFDAIYKDTIIIEPVLHDYFGIENDNYYGIIYGIYKGLIMYKGVSKQLIENCFFTNRLDELIHKKYTYHKSGYYENFCKNNIKIGNTYFNYLEDDENNKLIINTDDYCPSCDTIGYYTKNNHKLNELAPPDCYVCGNFICKLCCNYDKNNNTFICYKCEHPNIKVSIDKKIINYKKTDMNNFGIEGNITTKDIMLLLNKQKFKCYVCEDIVLTFGWKPLCLYQFSVDRIDNSLPHNKDNVLISCYYCNCISYFTNVLQCGENIKYKICDNNCHCDKRNIKLKREDISIDKINSLKINV